MTAPRKHPASLLLGRLACLRSQSASGSLLVSVMTGKWCCCRSRDRKDKKDRKEKKRDKRTNEEMRGNRPEVQQPGCVWLPNCVHGV